MRPLPLRRRVTRLTPSHGCLLAVSGGIAAADVWLIRHNHHTLSTTIRRSRWLRPVVVYLAAHLLFDFAWDPLSRMADKMVVDADGNLR